MIVTVTVNDRDYTREIEPRTLLVHFLRDDLDLTGTHWGCDTSNCGTCVVLMDGDPVKACTVLAATAEGHQIRTVEGLEAGGVLDVVQTGFAEEHGLQCGFCTAGMMMTARALLDRQLERAARDGEPVERLSDDEIRDAISGQICRCTGYTTIVRSIRWAEEHSLQEEGRGMGVQPSFEGVDR
jgi:aerobic carbon-monoxide dehydrogenase small subunit